MDKYEISLWEDYQDSIVVNGETKTFLNERKLCVIGAETMTAQVRALEPKFVQNINGTHTLTFKMFYRYHDNETNEEYENPFLYLLVNERKVKVRWKNKWYDLVIKKCQEDTSGKSIIYTCTDLFINELSRNGFEINFSTDLQNNIGTVEQLAETTLEGTTWQFDPNSDQIFQRTEEPVYEITSARSITCMKQIPGGTDVSTTIPNGSNVLLFYSCVSSILDGCKDGIPPTEIQVLYDENGYQYKLNSITIANGDNYLITGITSIYDEETSYLIIKQNNNTIFTINLSEGISKDYRAERLVKSPLTEFDPLVNRYVTLCKETSTNKYVYLIESTSYTDPLAITNIIANPNQFKNVNGWIPVPGNTNEISWQIYPKFNSSTQISSYTAKSYLKLIGTVYNGGLSSNISYFTPTGSEIKEGKIGGFQKGEKYVFRFKAVTNNNGSPTTTSVTSNIIDFAIQEATAGHEKAGGSTNCFTSSFKGVIDGWVEYELTCNTAKSANEIKNLGIFITIKNNATYWFEELQLFKYALGKTSYEADAPEQRMNPGEINLQSIVEKKYNYYYKDHSTISDVKDLKYIYSGTTESNSYPIQYNKYEKLATISAKQSNRFNILQSIAESFKCWIKFRVEHDVTGKIQYIDGVPQKFVTFIAEIGEDKGLCFEYGIDLKSISRTVDSDNIATKVIVLDNSNEFAQNGFCTIMRSNENYSKANFLLNFDYYIQQGLLSDRQIEKDLYGTSNADIGYYYNLRWNNRDYDAKSSELTAKRMDLLKQNSQLTTYKQYLTSAEEKKNSIMDDVMKLASATTWVGAQSYVQSHTDNTRVQSLMNSYAEVENQILYYQGLIGSDTEPRTGAYKNIHDLKNHISSLNSELDTIIQRIDALNDKFNEKYFNYIQEGTWQDESYTDDDKYYLDAVGVSYTSSRPQITYSINVVRLSGLEEFSSKIFNIGDVCYIIDREYFGYSDFETKTPYKEQIIVTEITSNFDSPEKDVIQVRNYKTKFDDLFQRIAASTQSLQYAEGEYTRAAGAINSNRTLSFSLLQDTFDLNENLILNASNQDVTWDETGITVTNKLNTADKTKIIAGGIFVTNDGGVTWKNAVRGDGISTELLTAGRVDTSQIYVYDGNHPAFRWDSDGLTAYFHDGQGTNFGRFVRHDRFGLYGYWGSSDFIPNGENDIWNNTNTKFALTWKGFMLRTGSSGSRVEISSDAASTAGDNEVIIKAVNSSNQETFALCKNGNLRLSGNITWNSTSNPTKVLYNRTNAAVPTDNYNNYPNNYSSTNRNGWHKVLNSTYDKYASYSYDGGTANSWSTVVQIAGSDANVTRDNIAAALDDVNTNDGIYAYTDPNNPNKVLIGLKATAIKAGKVAAEYIDADNLKVKAANITGTLVIGQLPDTVAEKSEIPTNNNQLTNGAGYKNATGVTSIINGTVTTDFINALNITAQDIQANRQIVSPTIYSGSHTTLASTESGFYLSASGLSIGSGFETDSNGSIKLRNSTYGKIYSGSHSTYSSSESGFYLGKDGLSIGSGFKADSSGNLILSGNITWNTNSNPTKVIYNRDNIAVPSNTSYGSFPADYNASSYNGWHKTLNSSRDLYASYSYNGGLSNSWSEIVQVNGKGISSITKYYAVSASNSQAPTTWYTTIQTMTTTNKYLWSKEKIVYTDTTFIETTPCVIGVHGTNGRDGTDAQVTFNNVNNVLGNLFIAASSGKPAQIDETTIYAPELQGGKIYGCEIYAGSGDGSYAEMTETGLSVKVKNGSSWLTKIGLGYIKKSGAIKYDTPYLNLGAGTNETGATAGLIMKFSTGIWIGNSAVLNQTTFSSPDEGSNSNTGIFIKFSSNASDSKIYKYINGTRTEISTATFG